MGTNTIWFLLAFAAYLLMMLGIGAFYMKKNKDADDYFLGGRGLSGWVAALSAQASDMSGWLLMGLPGSIYALGTGQAWIAVGLDLHFRQAPPLYHPCEQFRDVPGISGEPFP